ncbi:MAG: 50S ribosomal protein L25/general stress protein Ctc [Desulfosarcina sp.]|nr:50S ribosomal protein L25/general stress protein Ctc [Desulfosarcina sp.]MBC2744475.1 50S ribosomal protein L25/general stress protein Ctc [Desulfosarcina sp.]MBC2767383.1 50S ribosomal protein L25/general stress protein Ctc [Desulfosarcina sp.]
MNLKASLRETVGNGPSRVLRREGKIPAILYGPKTEPVKLTIDKADLEPIFKSGAAAQKLLKLEIEGVDGARNVMIKEMQKHPVSRNLLHLDLYAVSMDQKIRVMVPVVTTGKSKGVEMGGILQIIRRELEVLCLADQIPENITIDVTDLDVGDSFHVEDLPLERDIEVPADVNFTILTILSTKVEEEEVEEEVEEGEEEGAEGAEAAEEPAAE